MTLQSQTVKLVNRRPAPERKALAFMRGGAPGADMKPVSGQIDRPPYLLPFSQLRSYAMRLDLTIHPPANPYLSECERRILMWLAIAQRVSAHERDYHEDAAFTRMLFHCAGILTGLGICLPPVTMANGRTGMRDAAKACA